MIWVRGEFRYAIFEHNFEPLSSCTPGTDPSQARPRTLLLNTLIRYIGLSAIEIKNYSLLVVRLIQVKKEYETKLRKSKYPINFWRR